MGYSRCLVYELGHEPSRLYTRRPLGIGLGLKELPRTILPKLFGKGPKASQPSVFDAKKRPIEAPSYLLGGPQGPDWVPVSLFQTVSPRTPVHKAER